MRREKERTHIQGVADERADGSVLCHFEPVDRLPEADLRSLIYPVERHLKCLYMEDNGGEYPDVGEEVREEGVACSDDDESSVGPVGNEVGRLDGQFSCSGVEIQRKGRLGVELVADSPVSGAGREPGHHLWECGLLRDLNELYP